MDVARSEATEKELDTMIRRRHDARVVEEGERPVEEAWAESERRHAARRKVENDAAWLCYHRDQAERLRRNLEDLVARHEAEAARLEVTDERKTA